MTNEEKIKRIKELNGYVVKGLVNGLTHTIRDGRTNNIDWVRKRLNLWESFGRSVINIVNDSDSKYEEEDLKKISKEGFGRQISEGI